MNNILLHAAAREARIEWFNGEAWKMPEKYKLPSGALTSSPTSYFKAWRALAKPICGLTGAKLYSFDPNIYLIYEGRVFGLPVGFLKTLNESLK